MYAGSGPSAGERLIDLHSHLLAGVDDGASDPEEARAGVTALWEEGVRTVGVTPHLDGALTVDPEAVARLLSRIAPARADFRSIVAEAFPDMRVVDGFEIMLNTPAPNFEDPALRLGGSTAVLVEFPNMMVPPNSVDAVFRLRMAGWVPVIAHPERYSGVDGQLWEIGEWRRVGGVLQVNVGSLLGRYGERASATAWRLLKRGWVDLLASDYHARGRPAVRRALEKLEEKGGTEQRGLLTEANPARLLAGEPLLPVPPLEPPRASGWRSLFRRAGFALP